MDAYVITIKGDEYSERVADRCVASANIPVMKFDAVTPQTVKYYMTKEGLLWTWGQGYFEMQHKPYGGNDLKRMACFMSHYYLWELCCTTNEPILILEHDAVFVRPFEPFEFTSACMINDPKGATPRGDWWSAVMQNRGPGVWPKTHVFDEARPDGLAGNSAYVIQPTAAWWLIELARTIGAWPNDALMCRQLVSGLEEHYPFITEVRAEQSTIQ